jgi:hypothetical protein
VGGSSRKLLAVPFRDAVPNPNALNSLVEHFGSLH